MKTIRETVKEFVGEHSSKLDFIVRALEDREFNMLNSSMWARSTQPAPTEPGHYFARIFGTESIAVVGVWFPKDRAPVLMMLGSSADHGFAVVDKWFGPVPTIEERQP